jgi:integrase
MPKETHTTTRIAPDGPGLSFEDVYALISGWSVARPIEEFIAELNQRYPPQGAAQLAVADPKPGNERRGKSMSRRTGQSGHIEPSGKWWVVRWWMDVPGQDKRAHKRERICPISGPGTLSKSARERRARDIIVASGADTEAHFKKVVTQVGCVTFREQAETWFTELENRKRHPVADSTLEGWGGVLRNWLYPSIGDLPLSEINNAALKRVVSAMVEGGLTPQTITNYTMVLKLVVASAIDEEGEEIYPRKWNHKFVDMPVIVKAEQNTPCFSPDMMSSLATYHWKYEWTQVLVILCAAAGLRIGEALGLEIDKHISSDFRTLSIKQKVRNAKVEARLKTEFADRKVDLHPTIAPILQKFVGERRNGLLFCAGTGKPLRATNVLTSHIYPALKKLGYINPFKGDHRAGCHAFRRFRNTHLRNFTACPVGLQKFWMGHAEETMGDLYDKGKEDNALRKNWADRCGLGFDLPPVVPVVPKIEGNDEVRGAA